MPLPNKDNRFGRPRENLPNHRGHARPSAIHQRFDFHTAGKGGFFRRPHRGGAHDRRVQSILRTLFVLLFLAARAALLAAAMTACGLRRSFPASAETFRRHPDKIAAERNAPQTRGQRPGRCRLSLNAARDLLSKPFPIIRTQRKTPFGWIREKPAFDQDRRNSRFAQNIKTAPPNSTVLGGSAGENVAMDALREIRAVAPIIICLDPVRAGTRRAVEMNGDEGRAGISVRDRDPAAEGNENVAVPSHDNAIAARLQNALEPLGDIKGLVFLADPLAGNAAAIMSPVAGIDHDRARLAEGGRRESDEACKSREEKSWKTHREKRDRRLQSSAEFPGGRSDNFGAGERFESAMEIGRASCRERV